jgi:predicted secreted Zn-dependent protease
LWFSGTQAHLQPSADSDTDLISWNEFYKIQWHDFQGEPGEGSIGDAGAFVQIKAKPFLVKKKVNYNVVALFNRRKSWARDHSESLLAHEQLHFDIAELYARKIRKKVKELNDRGVKDIKTYNAAIQDLLLESNKADQQYDLETLHGALSKKQAAWVKKVKEELSALQRYKKTKRIIGAG